MCESSLSLGNPFGIIARREIDIQYKARIIEKLESLFFYCCIKLYTRTFLLAF